MGKGGRATVEEDRNDEHLAKVAGREGLRSRAGALASAGKAKQVKCALDQPTENLPTKKQIRDAIPAHCFEHSYVTALAHLARDLTIVAAFGMLALATLRTSDLRALDWAGWAVYAYFQGSAFTGLWVLAHECGHGGYSASEKLNDAVGFVLHSALMVPYYSWQFSHGKHHAKTNHMVDGESHNPDLHSDLPNMLGMNYLKLHAAVGDDAFAAWQLFAHLAMGWPLYLLLNVTGGRRTHAGKPMTTIADHFRPTSALFPPSWRLRIAASSVGCLTALAGLVFVGRTHGASTVLLLYLPPYLVCNAWLVMYTWLQHTREDIPHYGDDEWSWVKGALSTIDRPYAECFGFHDWMHHHIGSTHVFHHVFSNAPCYKAVEATVHIKSFLEPKGFYNYDARPIAVAAWQTAQRCHYVDSIEGAQYFKKLSKAQRPKKSAQWPK